jgi:uncharacterized protein (DUF1330 family)
MIVYLESITDAAELAEYRRIGVPTLAASKAKFLVRNGRFEMLEGPAPHSVLLLEFPTMADAKEWYESPQYQQAAATPVCRRHLPGPVRRGPRGHLMRDCQLASRSRGGIV